MADSNDRVSLELIDAGDHKDRVVSLLSRVKGLSMPPEQIVNVTPCTIATDVPRTIAEKLQKYLEKAGAAIMLENEADLLAPDDLPIIADQSGSPEASDEVLEFTEGAQISEESSLAGEELDSKHWQPKRAASDFGEELEPQSPPEKKKSAHLLPARLVAGAVGFLIGAILMGGWGWFSIRSMQRDAEINLSDYNRELAQQIEEHSAGLRGKVQQQTQEIQGLSQQNTELTRQVETLKTRLKEASARTPQSIIPSHLPEIGVLTPDQEAIVSAFETVKERHTQSLEKSYEAQKQASCSRQTLLDGKGTTTYAQILRKFRATHTAFDIQKHDSLFTPYIAELKIPFQQEMRTGKTEEECNAATFQQVPSSTKHHEFGSYYGYWTIQYIYNNGKWIVKPTVLEKNRALYEMAFKLGSPDHAKFLIDTTVFAMLNNL
jgi:hypothetical protein